MLTLAQRLVALGALLFIFVVLLIFGGVLALLALPLVIVMGIALFKL